MTMATNKLPNEAGGRRAAGAGAAAAAPAAQAAAAAAAPCRWCRGAPLAVSAAYAADSCLNSASAAARPDGLARSGWLALARWM